MVYYSQKYLINEIHNRTGYPVRDINNIFGSLRNVVRDKLSDSSVDVEIKLFPGLSVTSRHIPLDRSVTNLCNKDAINSDYLLYLNGRFSDRFKKEIRNNKLI